MFVFILKMFIGLLSAFTIESFSESLISTSKGCKKCVPLNNWLCQARPTLININSNERLFYPFTGSVNKCDENCNTIDDPYTRVCAPGKAENMNVEVFNLMLRINELRCLVQHESCEHKRGLNESVRNSKMDDGCWCKCKKLDD